MTLADGKQIKIGELQSGDQVLAYDDKTKKIISTHVITMLDNQPNQFGRILLFLIFIILFLFFFSPIQTINYSFWSSIVTYIITSSSN